MAEDDVLPIPGFEGAVEIGRGGFGVVYRARQIDVQRTVAIKVLTGALDEHARVRFDRERDAMGLLSSHPNSVTVHASGFAPDGRPFIVMEYLEGASLADRLVRGSMEWREAVEIGIKLSGALEAAHRAGVLHRDVKPENVLISAYGEPKLADFGIARLEGGPETRSGSITASLYHAAPEVFEGKRPTQTTDVYSLASTIYALITASAPFARETDESIVPLFARVATEPVPDLRPRGVPDIVCTVLEHGLAKDPGERIGSAREFGERLQAAQRSLGIDVTPMVGAARTAGGPPSTGAGRPTPDRTPPPVTDSRTGRVPPPTSTPRPGVEPPTSHTPPRYTPPPIAPPVTPAPTPGGPSPGPPIVVPRGPGEPDHPKRTRSILIGVIAIVVLVAVVGGALLLAGGGDGTDPNRPAASRAPVAVSCPPGATPLASRLVDQSWRQPAKPLNGAVRAKPIVTSRVAVVATDRGVVAGFQADAPGTEVFREALDGGVIGDPGFEQVPGADALLRQGTVFLATLAGGIYRVDAVAKVEHVARVFKTESPLGGVAMHDGIAYVGRRTVGGGLLMVDTQKQKLQRTIETEGTVFGKPYVDSVTKAVYFATNRGFAYRVPFPADGSGGVRKFKLRGPVEAGVTIAAGRLIVATTAGAVQALDPDDGKEAWFHQLPAAAAASGPSPGVFFTPAASAAAGASEVVVASSDCSVTALDGRGERIWQRRFDRPVSAAPVVVGGVVLTTTEDSVNVLLLAKYKVPIIRSYCPNYDEDLRRCVNDIRPTALSEDGTQVLVGLRAGQVEGMKYQSLDGEEMAAAAAQG